MPSVLITGAAKNLGAAIACALAQSGYDLVLHARHSHREVTALAAHCQSFGVRATPFIADLTSLEDFIRRYQEAHPITYGVVHNVGNYCEGAPSQISEGLHHLLHVNLRAPLSLTEALLPSIKAQKGRIVFLGTAGLGSPWTRAAAYGLTKEALLSYTRSLAKELAPAHVTVNMVSPGHLPHSIVAPPSLPMGPGTNEEVASLIAHLFSSSGRYITGQNLDISGGV